MVALDLVKTSNAQIGTELPASLVGVFVGATSGIGEYTLKKFAKNVKQPRAYFIGRNQEEANRIKAECQELNANGEYIFLQADTSLLRNVDSVTTEIKAKEDIINLLVLSQGTLIMGGETDEGLQFHTALTNYGRIRFIVNLLPLIERAKVLRRVVSVLAGGYEGAVDITNLQARGWTWIGSRAHVNGVQTLLLTRLAQDHPTVSFIHAFPGMVHTNIARDPSILSRVLNFSYSFIGPFVGIGHDESGERHLYLATSAQYPAKDQTKEEAGVAPEASVSNGIDEQEGSGIYVINEKCDSSAASVERVLTRMRANGTMDAVWEDLEQQFKRVTGKVTA